MAKIGRPTLDHSEIVRLYAVEEWTITEIADYMYCGVSTVYNILDRYGIEIDSSRKAHNPAADLPHLEFASKKQQARYIVRCLLQ